MSVVKGVGARKAKNEASSVGASLVSGRGVRAIGAIGRSLPNDLYEATADVQGFGAGAGNGGTILVPDEASALGGWPIGSAPIAGAGS